LLATVYTHIHTCKSHALPAAGQLCTWDSVTDKDWAYEGQEQGLSLHEQGQVQGPDTQRPTRT